MKQHLIPISFYFPSLHLSRYGSVLAFLLSGGAMLLPAQYAQSASTSGPAASAPRQELTLSSLAAVTPDRPYALDELIDIAEHNNPRSRVAWEQAKQAAEHAGMARSEYFPHLAGMALIANEKFINPFPKPLAPQGYTMVENPSADAGLALQYTILDFGRRHARLATQKALQLASTAHLQRVHQDVAYSVVLAYNNLATAQEHLAAMHQIVTTAHTTESAAEAQLANGRATLPDVLHAKAETAHTEYELEAAIGEVEISRVHLREVLGVEPSDAIQIVSPEPPADASQVATEITELVQQAQHDRSDLAALAQRMHAAEQEFKLAQSAYRPTVEFESKGAVRSIWPTVSKQGGDTLADTTQFVWNVGIRVRLDLFDGGLRKKEILARASEQREAAEMLREKQDEITRETWTAYLHYKTAVRQQRAAQTLLSAATVSYQAALEAYGYGVKNLIDLVTAESQLAEARLADVQARSAVLTSAATLGYATGGLLQQPPSTLPVFAAQP